MFCHEASCSAARPSPRTAIRGPSRPGSARRKGREMAPGPGAGVTIADPVRLGLAEGDPVRCVMRCHEPPRRAPLRRLRRSAARLHSTCRSSIAFRSTPFRSRRRRLACGGSLFRAYRMCARTCVRVGAVRAPDCARASQAQGARLPSVSQQSFRTGAKQETKQPADAASSCPILPQFSQGQPKSRNYI